MARRALPEDATLREFRARAAIADQRNECFYDDLAVLRHIGSNRPVWSSLGVHALDASDPEQPVIVHGFVERDAEGVTVIPNWDTLGMRPSQSYDGVFVPDARIGAVIPAGSSEDPFLVGLDNDSDRRRFAGAPGQAVSKCWMMASEPG